MGATGEIFCPQRKVLDLHLKISDVKIFANRCLRDIE